MRSDKPLVSIIIPAFRTELYIEPFIKSLNKSRYRNVEFIIVFDPSPDRGIEITRKLVLGDKRWKVYVNKKRIGSTKCLNFGIKKAKGSFVGFISCDILVKPDWLDKLVSFLNNSDQSVGGAIAKFCDYHQKNLVQVYRLYLMRQTGWIVSIDIAKKDGKYFRRNIESFNGFEGLIVRREVFEKVGMFDEDIDALIYDLDMTWRVWLGGYKIVQIPASVVYHWSLKVGRQNTKWEFNYARILNVFLKNYSLKSLFVYVPQFLTIYTLRALILLAIGKPDALVGWVKAIIWSISNISGTMNKRNIIQNNVRKVSDTYLFNKIFYKGTIVDYYRYLKKTKRNVSKILMSEESDKKGVLTHSA